jgi:hypothetical protein
MTKFFLPFPVFILNTMGCFTNKKGIKLDDVLQLHVANMASFAISSSMILVIHDNMINETNHIV